MSGAGGPPQGANSAIASGAAFGAEGGGKSPGSVDTPLTIAKGPGKMLGDTQFASGELKGFFATSMNIQQGFGIGSWLDNISAGLDHDKSVRGIGSDAEGGDDYAGNSSADSGGASSGSDDNVPFTAMEGAALPPGMTGGEPVSHSKLGDLSPDATPTIGRSQEMGMGG